MIRDSQLHFAKKLPTASKYIDKLLGNTVDAREIKEDIAAWTGVASLDLTLGGLPSGIVELFGEESTGKSALLGIALAANQSRGMETALHCPEYFDVLYMAGLGVDLDKTVLLRGKGPLMFELFEDFLSEPNRLLAVDSLTALRPDEESPTAWNELVFNGLKGLSSTIRVGSCMIATSQQRARRFSGPGNPFVGGSESASRRVTDLYDVRLELTRENVSDYTYDMLINVVANANRKPAVLVRLPAVKGRGVDLELDLVRVARSCGVFQTRGSHYYFQGGRLAHGEREMADALKADDKLRQLVEGEVFS